jgi:hypothetical protein
MNRRPNFITCIVSMLLLTAISACTTPQVAPTPILTATATLPTETSTPTKQNSPTPSLTASPLPTSTPLPTATTGPTLTPSITVIPSPSPYPSVTPAALVIKSGMYTAGGCLIEALDYLRWCVVSMEVRYDGYMIVTLSWEQIKSLSGIITKRSDVGNKNMFLLDEMGRRYDHVSVEGDAAKDVQFRLRGTKPVIYGSYVFPPALPGATTFSFVDRDQGVAISDLALNQLLFSNDFLSLSRYPYTLLYRTDRWSPSVSQDGNKLLSYKEIPDCQIQELSPTKPQGSLINTMEIGNITYKIYYRVEGSKIIREYLAESGLPELNTANKPLLRVSMPAEKEVVCVSYAGDVLATLKPVKP